jgi:hypothetical protein
MRISAAIPASQTVEKRCKIKGISWISSPPSLGDGI